MRGFLLTLLGILILLAVVAIAAFVWLTRTPEPAPPPEPAAGERTVEAAGLNWRVREDGPAGAPAIVLIHGFSHSLESFDGWAEALSGDYRIIRFDLPGHGVTGPHPDGAYSNEDTAAQVAELLDTLELDRFAIGGNSLGGLVSWRYAAANPDRVAGLVLVSPGGYSINNVGDEPVEVPLPVQLYLRLAPDAGVRMATQTLYGDPSRLTEDRIAQIGQMMRQPGVGEALIARLQQFTLPDPEPLLATIDAPALILWGTADTVVPASHGPRFVDAMPGARLITYDGAGHMLMEEYPAETAADVQVFLQVLDW
ncbi:alpha/beta fold hydrolase [Glycocaulis abyssi]|uniref:Alpha/beta fold hydrolase n=1 Tax=Glycocaulis abyssi TaxID=1433403 RepID=A0ABV9NDE4_9PROT